MLVIDFRAVRSLKQVPLVQNLTINVAIKNQNNTAEVSTKNQWENGQQWQMLEHFCFPSNNLYSFNGFASIVKRKLKRETNVKHSSVCLQQLFSMKLHYSYVKNGGEQKKEELNGFE